MSLDLNLKVHLIGAQLLDTYFRPDDLMVGHPFFHVGFDELMLGWDVRAVGGNFEDLQPTLPTSILEVDVDILKGLRDFAFEVLGDEGVSSVFFPMRIPAACKLKSVFSINE